MKKLVFLGACLVALASQPVMAQAGGPDVVVMSVRRILAGRVRIVLAYSELRTEEAFIGNTSTSDRAQDEATGAYQRIIAKLYQQGYALKSAVSQDEGAFTTLIFVKGQ